MTFLSQLRPSHPLSQSHLVKAFIIIIIIIVVIVIMIVMMIIMIIMSIIIKIMMVVVMIVVMIAPNVVGRKIVTRVSVTPCLGVPVHQ